MKKRKKSRNFPFFWTIYGGLLFVFAVGVSIGIGYLNMWLADFEANQERACLQAHFDRVRQGEIANHIALSSFEETRFSSLSEYVAYVRNYYQPEDEYVFYLGERSEDPDTKNYEVYRNGEPIAQAVIRRQNWKSAYGFDVWELDKVTDFIMLEEIQLTVPSRSDVRINGVPLTADDQIGEPIDDLFPDASSYGIFSTEKVTYHVPKGMLLFYPEISVRNAAGRPCAQVPGEDKFRLHYRYSEQHREELEALTKEVSELLTTTVAKSKQGDIRPYLNYLIPDTDYYRAMKNWKNHWFWTQGEATYTSHVIEDLHIDYYEEFSEQNATVRIRYNFKETTSKNTILDFPISYEIHYLLLDGQWKILSQTNY